MEQLSSLPQPDSAKPYSAWKEFFGIGLPMIAVALAAFAVACYFVKPAPPAHVVIATGSKTGMYYAMATRYADYFASNGITLEVRETTGTGENYQLLQKPETAGDPASRVDAAIVQGGAAPPKDQRAHLQAVAGIYYEPVLIFVRKAKLTQLNQLAGKKIAIGVPGSGTRLLATQLLTEAGVTDGAGGTSLVNLGGDAAADALTAGGIDAAFYVIAPDVPLVRRLIAAPGISLMSLEHARAYSRLHPFLSATTLYQGVVDVKNNLPASDVELVAAPATIVVRDTTHSAVIELLVRAAQEFNTPATLLANANTFPNADQTELPLNRDAKYFLKNPPSILHRTLPFWLASMIDRLIILIVPLLVVLIPLMRMMPPALRWRTQRRLLQQYKHARSVEEKLSSTSSPSELQAGHAELLAMDSELANLRVPLSFARDLYNLRLHVSFARARISNWITSDDHPKNARSPAGAVPGAQVLSS
jgi:TRAP transporter TAXI family solute receptor